MIETGGWITRADEKEMTMPAIADTRPDVQDMIVVHRNFRHNFDRAPALIRGLREGDTARIRLVVDHLRFLLTGLEVHHSSEDDLLWPKLRERVIPLPEAISRMTDQHHQLDILTTKLTAALNELDVHVDADIRERAAGLCEELGSVVDAHMTEEEETILPLAAAHLTVAEWEELGERGLEKLAKKDLLPALSSLLAVATPEERKAFLAKAPVPARVLWRLVGRRAHARAEARLYGN
ncbi:hemerythrin domain-containing protein [Nocardia sp. NPDC051030]|uniref:hemerythrin domain-containing protein n=1 Tax=Nocardia sp. NPDC051030 TaxID=3155162 RepID=UPI00343D3A8E